MSRIFAALILLGIALGTNACKKGEDDPFISLASRTSRLTGTWELVSYSEVSTTDRMQGGNFTTEERTKTLENGNLTSTSPYAPNTVIAYSSTLTFYKEGIYEATFNGSSNQGTWWWKDAGKSKTSIGFSSNFSNNIILHELSNKQMVWQIDSYNEDLMFEDDYLKTTTTITYTYQKQ